MTMPYLEPYLIRSILRAREYLDDPGLLEDMAGFNRQEANHFKCHRRYNECSRPTATLSWRNWKRS